EREGGAADRARDDHRRDRDPRRVVAERDPRGRAEDGPRIELALAADVEELHAERDGCAETGEDERRRRDERVVQRLLAPECGAEQRTEGVEGGMVREEKDDRDQHEGGEDRADGHGDRQPLRLHEAALDADHSRWPPAIRRPSSSTVATAASSSPTIAPS